MRHLSALSLVIALVAFGASAHAPIVLGYYPSWPCGVSPEAIDFGRFTHICHAFVTAEDDGTPRTGGNLPSRALSEHAHAEGVKVLLSIGGMDSDAPLAVVMANSESATRFVEGVTALAAENGYDGVDIDWEFPSSEAGREGLVRMARMFRGALDREIPGALVTAAFSGQAWPNEFVDTERLRPLLDFVSVMTYDVHGPWSHHAGLNAPLTPDPADRPQCQVTSLTGQMARWTDEFDWPRGRLLVGIPCYGRGFPVSAWYASTERGARAEHPYVSFHDVDGLICEGWQRHWSEETQTPWLSRPGTEELISYDDEQSARTKGAWATRGGFAGVFFWEISQDFASGENALVRAALEGWREADRVRVATLADDAMPESFSGCLAALGSAEDIVATPISGEAIRRGALEGFDVFVIPGGSGSAANAALGKFGRGIVLERVRAGMGAIGICAGGYAMLTGAGHTPLVNADLVDDAHWERGIAMLRVVPLGVSAEPFMMQYWNGPLWAPGSEPSMPAYSPLATFVDEVHDNGAPSGVMQGTPAIIAAPLGAGRVVLFSAHPELTPGRGGLLASAARWAARGQLASGEAITWESVLGAPPSH